MPNHRLIVLLAALTLPGCEAPTAPERAGPPEDRGSLVASYESVSGLTWSTDGSELYFIEGDFRIRAVAATGVARTVYTSSVSLGEIRAVANTVYLSVSNGGSAGSRILRIDPATSTVEVVLTYSGQVRSHSFAVSADERYIAYEDSLFDRVAAIRWPLPMGQALSFSPDGSQLLYRLDGGTFAIIATTHASVQTVNTPSDIARATWVGIGTHYWTGNDPKVLRVTFDHVGKTLAVFVFDLRTAVNTEIASVTGDISLFLAIATVSTDGKQAAIWIGPGLWSELHMIDTDVLSRTVVAAVNGGVFTSVTEVVLSPDANRIAYVVSEGSAFFTPGTAKVYVVTP
jgi:hypothetical protein